MNKVFLGIVTVLACVCVCTAQADKKQSGSGMHGAGMKAGTAGGMNITAELRKTLDVKRARVGDEIVLKTTQAVRQDGEIVIPKGANLIGRVTEVQRRTKENSGSRIGLVFDRLHGKELSLPLSATIVSIANVATGVNAGDAFMSDVSGSSQTTASTSSAGSGRLLGGVTNTVGTLVNTTAQTAGTVTNTAGQTLGNTANMIGSTLNGVQISTEASGSVGGSTILSAPNRDLRIEKGARFQIRVAN
ncbi:MAG TPA: hypothetical protein VFZ23_13680 [Pyrinomonadaceae bacterium]